MYLGYYAFVHEKNSYICEIINLSAAVNTAKRTNKKI